MDGRIGMGRCGVHIIARLCAVLAVLSGIVLSQVVAAPPARADGGIEVSSVSRYVFEPDAQVVRATMEITLRNTSPNQPTGDGGYRYFFFNTYGIPLPEGATKIRARSNGATLRTSRDTIDGEPGFRMVEVHFPDLMYGQRRTIELTFTLEGQPPRSEDPTRVGSNHAAFPVFGAGDPGRSTVEVSAPVGFPVESSSDSFTASDGPDGTRVYVTTEDNLNPGFSATMSIRSREIGEGREVTAGGVPLVLVHFPEDTEWADFIETWTDQGIPVLEDLTGLEWPGTIDRIREDPRPDARGFAGWYSTSLREIVLSEDLDHHVLFHELAHAWSGPFEQRWVSEGFAEFLAAQTTMRLDVPAIERPDVTHTDTLAVPLDEWGDSEDGRSAEIDQWAYPASSQVMTRLLDGLDDEELNALLHEAHTASSAWDLPDRRDISSTFDSYMLLDLLDAHAAPSATDGTSLELYRDWVLDDEGLALLEERGPALAAYDEYTAPSPWGAPLTLRRYMSRWQYGNADRWMSLWPSLPEDAASVVELADRTDTRLPAELREEFELAGDERAYAALADTLADAQAALESYAQAQAAVDADRGVLARLGAPLLRVDSVADTAGEHISTGDYAASRTASATAIERADRATAAGAAVIALVVLALALAALVIRARRRSTRQNATHQSATHPDIVDAP